MKPHSYSSEGIVLGKKNYGEADKILILYSKEKGRVSLIAKGIRKPKSKKRGHIEVFNIIRYHATNGRGIEIMTEAEIIDNFKEIKNDLKKVSLAYYFCEVIGKITHENEKNTDLFDFTNFYLNKLKKAKKLKELRLDFISKLLILMGYWPEEKILTDPDKKLEEVIERQLSSVRVGKSMLE